MELTTGGWIFLVAAWGIIGGLCAFCMTRVLRAKPGRQNTDEA